jgi:hypothetical protein
MLVKLKRNIKKLYFLNIIFFCVVNVVLPSEVVETQTDYLIDNGKFVAVISKNNGMMESLKLKDSDFELASDYPSYSIFFVEFMHEFSDAKDYFFYHPEKDHLNIITNIEIYDNIVIVDVKWINNKINAYWQYFIEPDKPYFRVAITREVVTEAVYSNFQQCTMYNSDMDNSFIINYQGQLELTMGNYNGEKAYVHPEREGGYFSPFTSQHSLWTVFDYGTPTYFPTIAWSDNETNIHAGIIVTYTSPNQRETVSYHGGGSTKKHPGFAEAQFNWFGKSDSECLYLRKGTKFSMELYFYQNFGSIDSLWSFNEDLLSQNFEYTLPENYIAASWGARTSPLEHYYWRFPQVSSNHITSQELWRHKSFAIPRSQNGIWNIHLFSLNIVNLDGGVETELTPIYGITPLFNNLWIERDDTSCTGGMSWHVEDISTKLFYTGFQEKRHIRVSGELQCFTQSQNENLVELSLSPRIKELYIDGVNNLFSFIALDSILDTISIAITNLSGIDSFYTNDNRKKLTFKLNEMNENFTSFKFDLIPSIKNTIRNHSQIEELDKQKLPPYIEHFVNTTGNSKISFLPSNEYFLFNDSKHNDITFFSLYASDSFDSLKIAFLDASNYIAEIQSHNQLASGINLLPGSENTFVLHYPFLKNSSYQIKIDKNAQIEINEDEGVALPGEFKSISLYPNPFSIETTIKYVLKKSDWIAYEIFDITGRRIFTSSKNFDLRLMNKIHLNFYDLPTGVYFCRLYSSSSNRTLKILCLK